MLLFCNKIIYILTNVQGNHTKNHTNEWGSKMFKNMQDEIYEHIKRIHTA